MGRPMVRVNEPAPESPVAELQKTQGALPSEAFATAADHLWTQRFGGFFFGWLDVVMSYDLEKIADVKFLSLSQAK